MGQKIGSTFFLTPHSIVLENKKIVIIARFMTKPTKTFYKKKKKFLVKNKL